MESPTPRYAGYYLGPEGENAGILDHDHDRLAMLAGKLDVAEFDLRYGSNVGDSWPVGPSGDNSGIIDLPDLDPMPGAPKPDTTNWPTKSTYPVTEYSSSSSEELVVGPDPAADVHVRDASPSRKPARRPRGSALDRASFRNGTSIPCLGASTTDSITVRLGRVNDLPEEESELLVFRAQPPSPGRHFRGGPIDCLVDDDPATSRPLRVTAQFRTAGVKSSAMMNGTLAGPHWRITFDDLPPGHWWMRTNDGPAYRFSVPKPKRPQ
jgi:hypothetical protein